MKYVIVLAISMILAVGCNQNAKDIDQRITVLESSLTSLETKLNDTIKNLDYLQSSLDDTAESLSGFQLAVADVQPAQTGFVSGEATSLVIDKITETLLYTEDSTNIGYKNLLDHLGFIDDSKWVWSDKLIRRCAFLQKEITFGNSSEKFTETYIDNGVWQVSLTLNLPALDDVKAQPNFQFKWRVYEKANTVIAIHDQQGVPIC